MWGGGVKVRIIQPPALLVIPDLNPIGSRCHKFYENSENPCLDCPTIRSFNSGQVEHIERYNPANSKWYSIISQPVKNEDGEIQQVLEGITDITARKHNEQASSRSENRFRTLTETVPVGITLFGKDGYLQYANSQAEKILGRQFSDLQKLTYNDTAWQISGFDGISYSERQLP